MAEQSAGADNSARQGSTRQAGRLARSYLEALRAADAAGAYKIASQALAQGMPLAAIYEEVVTPAMYELGRLWERGAISVADEHLATALTHRVLAALRSPAFVEPVFEEGSEGPRAMLATVQGEHHALGLRMAADLLEDAGYETIYLGADVPTEALLRAIEALSPNLVGLSATMPESRARLEALVTQIRDEHPRLPLLLGGQASASPRIGEGTAVEDLQSLEDWVRPS
ncbi:MAG TPA: cobalamin-dependent protein [Solirubrobacterales bacterium]|nr:cobalamin-dependent protein [Solirubrobacterales bacterium]